MYCPAELHDTTSIPHDLKTMQLAWQNIYNKTKHTRIPYKIAFTGGEVTANKNFLPLIKWLKNTYRDIDMLLFTTNGSASLRYYLESADYVDAISFSTHSEFMDEQSFFNKAVEINKKMIRPTKSFHVNIMNEYWNTDRISLYTTLLEKENISYSVNQIDYQSQTRSFPIFKGKQNLHGTS
jgi:MoaA/NifB/PqqE/SkfB family radical SAM enzyme